MSENPDRVNFTVDPGWNPVPVRVITTGHPLFAEVGALTESVGDAPVTVNPLASVPVSEYWLVTVIFRLAAVAPVRSKVQVIWVAETTLIFVAMISGPAAPLTNLTAAPDRKLVPVIRSITVQPRTWVRFVMAVTVGSGLFTRNPPGRLPDWPSVLVITTSQNPGVSPTRLNWQVIRFGDKTTIHDPIWVVLPLLTRVTFAPFLNPDPAIVIEAGVIWREEAGRMADSAGDVGGLTVNPLAKDPDWVSGFVTIIFHAPVATSVRLKEHVIWVGDTTTTAPAEIFA